jgi:hypothetical protein
MKMKMNRLTKENHLAGAAITWQPEEEGSRPVASEEAVSGKVEASSRANVAAPKLVDPGEVVEVAVVEVGSLELLLLPEAGQTPTLEVGMEVEVPVEAATMPIWETSEELRLTSSKNLIVAIIGIYTILIL